MGQEEVDFQRDVDLALPQCYAVRGSYSPVSSPKCSQDKIFSIAQGLGVNSSDPPNKNMNSIDQNKEEASRSDNEDVDVVQDTGDNNKCLDEARLILQAQVLLTKNILYQRIGVARQQLVAYPSLIYAMLPRASDAERLNSSSTPTLTSLHRDATVNSLRFLNIFCNCSPSTFFLAAGLLDRLISTVQVHPHYLSSIGACCFYLASKTCEPPGRVPNPAELIKVSRCADNIMDFCVTERRILDTLGGNAASVTALTFLEYFYSVFRLYLGGLYQIGGKDRCGDDLISDDGKGPARYSSLMEQALFSCEEKGFNDQAFAVLTAKLEVLVCQFEFSQFRGDVLALALLSYDLQEKGILNHPDQFALVVELQYFCQISDVEFIHCRGLVIEYLAMYHRQPTKLPRLQLAWSVSRRTLHKMKPSTRASQDLEPILEDEPLSSSPVTDDETDNDSGPFDSECDDVDIKVGGVDGGMLKCDLSMHCRAPPGPDDSANHDLVCDISTSDKKSNQKTPKADAFHDSANETE